MNTVKIRPVALSDLDAIFELTQNIGYGVTHLPPEKNLLAEKIELSIQSFNKQIDVIQDELYFFVMEELKSNQAIGCCGIISQGGLTHPVYNYKIIQQVHNSPSLHMQHKNNFLQLTNDYQGLTEIGMLALLPQYQRHHYGKFLSRVRFLFLADNEQRVSEKIIAQIRGVVDAKGHSIFWRAIGKKFIELHFLEVDHLIAKGEEKFIAELLPDAPIAIELLSDETQEIIGIPHPNSVPACAMLKKEGFTFENYINIIDGGPCLELYLKHNPTIHHSKLVLVQDVKPDIQSDPYMIACINQPFCACMGAVLFHENNQVTLTPQTMEILNIQIGDMIRISL